MLNEARSVFSNQIKSIEISKNHLDSKDLDPEWNGRQVIFLLTFLPRLQRASFDFTFDSQDAKVVNNHLVELVESKRFQSKVKFLKMNIIPQYQRRRLDDSAKTFSNLLSIFSDLKALTLEFFRDDRSSFAKLVGSDRTELPVFEALEGLKFSSTSLTSLSILGLMDTLKGTCTEESILARAAQSITILQSLKKLEHLRLNGPLLTQLL